MPQTHHYFFRRSYFQEHDLLLLSEEKLPPFLPSSNVWNFSRHSFQAPVNVTTSWMVTPCITLGFLRPSLSRS